MNCCASLCLKAARKLCVNAAFSCSTCPGRPDFPSPPLSAFLPFKQYVGSGTSRARLSRNPLRKKPIKWFKPVKKGSQQLQLQLQRKMQLTQKSQSQYLPPPTLTLTPQSPFVPRQTLRAIQKVQTQVERRTAGQRDKHIEKEIELAGGWQAQAGRG